MVPKFQPQAFPAAPLDESRKTRHDTDSRLAAEERVFGLTLNGTSRAWPLKSLGKEAAMRTAPFGSAKAMILWDGRTRTAAAYAPETEGTPSETVNLKAAPGDSGSPWVDSETGSRWSIAGRAVSGSRKGQTLRWLPGVMVKWHAWAAEYPGTSLETQE
jgi:hypothetical protein